MSHLRALHAAPSVAAKLHSFGPLPQAPHPAGAKANKKGFSSQNAAATASRTGNVAVGHSRQSWMPNSRRAALSFGPPAAAKSAGTKPADEKDAEQAVTSPVPTANSLAATRTVTVSPASDARESEWPQLSLDPITVTDNTNSHTDENEAVVPSTVASSTPAVSVRTPRNRNTHRGQGRQAQGHMHARHIPAPLFYPAWPAMMAGVGVHVPLAPSMQLTAMRHHSSMSMNTQRRQSEEFDEDSSSAIQSPGRTVPRRAPAASSSTASYTPVRYEVRAQEAGSQVELPPVADDKRQQMFVTTMEQLGQLSKLVEQADVVGVDTEFLAFPSYRPQLQLLQISTPHVVAAVDVQCFQGTLGPFLQVLLDKELIMHDATGDLVLLYDLTLGCERRTPRALFDTYLAALFVGYGSTCSYAALVEKCTQVTLPKGNQLSDWSRRPLSSAQVAYALNDVRYLHKLRDSLLERLMACNRLGWYEQEVSDVLTLKRVELPDPRKAWIGIKRTNKLSPTQLSVLRELAAWREEAARQENKAPVLLLRDDALLAFAQLEEPQLEHLYDVAGVKPFVIDRYGPEILQAIQVGQEVATEQQPSRDAWDRPAFDSDLVPGPLVSLMSSWVQSVARAHSLFPDLLCSREDMHKLAAGMDKESKQGDQGGKDSIAVLHGWRKSLVGDDLAALRDGEPVTFDPTTGGLCFVTRKSKSPPPVSLP